jgi:4-amino-4-deoxychorismate lyase
MILAALINGQPLEKVETAIALDDRGLQYGDGLFETMLVRNGVVRFLEAHRERLAGGCKLCGIEMPPEDVLAREVTTLAARHPNGVIKVIVTRGRGGRGYCADPHTPPTRIVAAYSLPPDIDAETVRVRWCETRLGRNPKLGGIKHLNRLEQVLARNEWHDAAIGEGLMLDTEGEVICATAANVFVIHEGVLTTPDLRFCGIRGIMRAKVLQAALGLGLAVSEEPVWPADVETASEVFLTNALRGIRVVTHLENHEWSAAPVATQLRAALERN